MDEKKQEEMLTGMIQSIEYEIMEAQNNLDSAITQLRALKDIRDYYKKYHKPMNG